MMLEKPKSVWQVVGACAHLLWPWLIFFAVQGLFPAYEKTLLLCALGAVAYVFYLKYYPREWILFVLGVTLGLLVEVGLGLFYRTQHWQYASLLGVPYWLPVVWGYAFVVIRRLGNLIVNNRNA